MNDFGPLFGGPLEPQMARRIGHGSAPEPHKPTTAVPHGLLQDVGSETRDVCRAKGGAIADALAGALGRPFYERDGFVLYQRDCRDVLGAMAASGLKLDLTVTSPPYNIGKAYEQPLPLHEYIAWCAAWMESIYDVTKNGGAFWLNVGYLGVAGRAKAVPIAYLLWDKSRFFLQQEVVWNYGAGVTSKRCFAPRNEKFLFYTRDPDAFVFNLDDVRDPDVKYPNQKKNGKFRCNPLGKNPSDVWAFPKVTTGANRSSRERTPHPAQFPLGVVDRIIKVSSAHEDVVFDPFSGSGSTGIAAVGNGRVYVGSELREDYCAATVDRHKRYLELREQALQQSELALL
jgi:adenine-specific DNA-methyltransferase